MKYNAWNYNDLNAFHVELSTRCNAACPGCPRFLRNSTNVDPEVVQTDITIDLFKRWFPLDLVQKSKSWIFCGTHGDPLACNDIYDILDYICSNSIATIQINTNGGLRTPDHFRAIGELFLETTNGLNPKPMRKITFSIDGLEDTNHIYRRNVIWDKAWNNMIAYAFTGAHTDWDFLQFKHNKHQVELSRKIAQENGINFVLKNPFGVDGTGMPAYDKDYNLEYVLEHATDNGHDHYTPAPLGWEADMPAPVTEEGVIACNSFRTLPYPYHEEPMVELYIDALGRVHPCCFVGNKMQGPRYVPEAREMQTLQKTLGDANNLHHHRLDQIIDGGVLAVYSESWQSKSISQCWVQCGKSCGKVREIDKLFELSEEM